MTKGDDENKSERTPLSELGLSDDQYYELAGMIRNPALIKSCTNPHLPKLIVGDILARTEVLQKVAELESAKGTGRS